VRLDRPGLQVPAFQTRLQIFSACRDARSLRAGDKALPAAFGFGTFGDELHLCARTFVDLQKLRHDADYDPHAQFTLSETQAAIRRAEIAMKMIGKAPEKERRLFLLTLRYKHRS
jgi:hypothetical protein